MESNEITCLFDCDIDYGPSSPDPNYSLYNPEILSLIIDIAIAALPICVALAGMNALYRFFSRDDG